MAIALSDVRIGGAELRAALAQWSPALAVALDEEAASARARAWAARADPAAVVDGVRVGSVLYRPDGSCTLRYLVRLSTGRHRTLLVEVPRSATDIVIRPFPADPGLPTLPVAVDPALMRPVLGRVLPGTGGERAIGRCTVDVVHHPRQGRCVLRYRLSPGAGGAGELRHPVVFGKVYGDDDAAGAAAAALRLLRQELARLPRPARVTVPRSLAVVPSLRLGLVEAVPGRPLRPYAAGDGASASVLPLPDAVRTAARTAAALHLCGLPAAPLPARDLAAEIVATERDIAQLEPVWPDVATRLRPAVSRAIELTDDHPDATASVGWPLAPVLAHGDFTPSQMLLDGSAGAAVVDVDTVCVAEPALDVGRFLAYLHVAARRSRAEPADLTRLFLESYLAARAPDGGSPPHPAGARRLFLERAAAYHALALGRAGASACRQLKGDRLAAVLAVLDRDAETTWRSVAG
jgi:aminoglycoside phosphotransferase (APT) family kinase protein